MLKVQSTCYTFYREGFSKAEKNPKTKVHGKLNWSTAKPRRYIPLSWLS